MMTETERIADQLERAFKGGAWHGPSLTETLQGVTARQATAKPIAEAHSIWELALHIAAWEGVVMHRVSQPQTTSPVPDGTEPACAYCHLAQPAEGDWPPISEPTEAAWQQTLELLKQRHEDLLAVIRGLADDHLNLMIQTGTGSGISVYATLHGAIQHNLYHAGQMALLKKAL